MQCHKTSSGQWLGRNSARFTWSLLWSTSSTHAWVLRCAGVQPVWGWGDWPEGLNQVEVRELMEVDKGLQSLKMELLPGGKCLKSQVRPEEFFAVCSPLKAAVKSNYFHVHSTFRHLCFISCSSSPLSQKLSNGSLVESLLLVKKLSNGLSSSIQQLILHQVVNALSKHINSFSQGPKVQVSASSYTVMIHSFKLAAFISYMLISAVSGRQTS